VSVLIPLARTAFAFPNPIDEKKVERYRVHLRRGKKPPAIKAYRRMVSEDDVERGIEFVDGHEATAADVGLPIYFIRDGYHRAIAALLEGRETIAAVGSDPRESLVGMALGTKSENPMKDSRILKDRLHVSEAWKWAVYGYAVEAIKRHINEPVDATTRAIVRKRVEKLAEVLSFYKKNSDYVSAVKHAGPFDAVDGAALILWRKDKAYKLAKKLIAGPMVDNFFHPSEPALINMDWFDFKIEGESNDATRAARGSGRASGRSSLRAFMNQRAKDPHFYVVDERGWIAVIEGDTLQPPFSVGSDAGGYRARRWKTVRGAEAFARASSRPLFIRFAEHSDKYE